jgi:hypothetical protein
MTGNEGVSIYTFRLDQPQVDALDVCAQALGVDRSTVLRGCISEGVSQLASGKPLTSAHKGLSTTLQMSPTAMRQRKVSYLRGSDEEG